MAEIHRDCFGPASWSAESFVSLFATDLVFGYLIDPGGLVIARVVADEAEILTIGVVALARRRGIGGRLLGLALDHAKGRGAAAMFLEVAADNIGAVTLYRSAGFETCGRRREYYGPGTEALLFKRPLCE